MKWYVYVNLCDALSCYNDLQAFNTRQEAVDYVKKLCDELNSTSRHFRIIYGREEEFHA